MAGGTGLSMEVHGREAWWIPLEQGPEVTPEREEELAKRLGGKAAALRRLAGLGHPVGPALVILPEAFALALEPDHPCPRRLPDWLEADMRRAVQSQLPSGGRLAVRSSAPQEDGRQRSFAGQYTSVLEVEPDDLARAVLAVWASAFEPSVRAYSSAAASTPAPFTAPAVLVQPMLRPLVAGVAFSADPLTGQRGVTVIQAVAGVAADLLAGTAEGDLYHLSWDDRVLESRPLQAGRPLLDRARLLAVHHLVRQVARDCGTPQDVEWALEAPEHPGGPERLWLLQARPITTLARVADPDGVVALWDNSNIVESYSGVTTPLTFSFARKAYTEVYTQFCLFMGVPASRVRRHRRVFATMIGFLEGRIYYNLHSWYRVLSLLPGYGLNAAFLEQMLGVQQPLETRQRERLRLEPPVPPLRDLLRLVRASGSLLGNYLTLERRRRNFLARLDRVLPAAHEATALAEARPDQLVERYRAIEAELLNRWDAPLINDFYAMVLHGVLGRLLERWGLDAGGGLRNAWISEIGSVISSEPPRRIAAMAALVVELDVEQPALVTLLRRGSLPAIRRALATVPELEAALNDYLAVFGDRCLEELKLESLTLRDDPLPLLRTLGAAAAAAAAMTARSQQGPSSGPAAPRDQTPAQGLARAQVQATAQATDSAPLQSARVLRGPQRWLLFGLRRQLRRLVANRENLRFERTRVFGLARRLLLELGRRLAALDRLDRAEDVFFLEVDEVMAVVEGNGTTTDLRGLVALRRAEWQRHGRQPPLPRRFETRGLPTLDLPPPPKPASPLSDPGDSAAEQVAASTAESVWQGTACSPGRVRGKVALVNNPRAWLEGPGATANEPRILVAACTDPGWVLLFPQACALLVERGSVLSHVAIVARELGLPMVTELAGLSSLLQNDDWLEIDGGSGLVRRCAGPEPGTW
ncbi:phosphoenolpyruvate synthase [Synechococcus sp. CBW1002]|uniref:PEP/pyruvate-binding domain-containing protein n=1 Tax=Synechococcus sp. CBW1002 TaxID=1353134 RepID=UPI0018CCE872|nr:PEP/pyruvate-binding domain-containing protein [Synechococcus sp. CBW1002]QPN59866.1 phosphoenolpyruvate synthase [Synechococcus sp. CBW1002]